MYYNVEEINYALTKATEIINERTVNKGFIRGYSDCFCFLIEYDKALRNNKSKAEDIFKNISYRSPKEYLIKLREKKLTLKSFAKISGYEIRSNLRPKLGDIGYMDGSALIAGDGHWITTSEKSFGIQKGSRYHHIDKRLHLLARPLKEKL